MNYTPSEKNIICQRFDSFIKKCCRNEARNEYKRIRIIENKELPFSSFKNIDNVLVGSDIELPDFRIKDIDVSINDFSLLTALQNIDPHEREIILLKFFMRFTDEEISEELDICRRIQ